MQTYICDAFKQVNFGTWDGGRNTPLEQTLSSDGKQGVFISNDPIPQAISGGLRGGKLLYVSSLVGPETHCILEVVRDSVIYQIQGVLRGALTQKL